MGLISWWYTGGWRMQWSRAVNSVLGTVDFFSIGQLLETFFDPFRQISAGGTVSTEVPEMLKAFGDKLFSRIVGMIIRLSTILIGCFVIVIHAIYQFIIFILWLFVPILPIVGLILFAMGWVPQWI